MVLKFFNAKRRYILGFSLLLIFSCYAQENLDKKLGAIQKQLIKKDDIFAGKWPEYTTDGKWQFRNRVNWFSGFIGGELFLMYKMTGNEDLKRRALIHADSLLQYANIDYTHDMGFIFLPSVVKAYYETGDQKYKDAAIKAAEMLYKRYNTKGNFIRAWGKLGSEDRAGWMIIDTMMNLELLFWAYENTGLQKYYDIALAHAKTVLKESIRRDYSSYHIVEFDTQNGNVLKKRTHQGYSDESTWARGQAWGIYGFTTTFKQTGDSVFLKTAQKMADYYINRLPEDYVPYWDLDLSGNEIPRDASAGAILASGLYDLAELSDNKSGDSKKYLTTATKISKSLLNNYTFQNSKRVEEQGLLIHTIYHFHNKWGFDESYPAGDYYFMETLYRYYTFLRKNKSNTVVQ